MNSLHVSFDIKDKGHSIIGVNSLTLPTPVTQDAVVENFPQFFWYEKNTNGEKRLCAVKTMYTPFTITCTDGTTEYEVNATPFEPVYFLDGHPTTVPIFRPR